jgi:hypothetical protein
MNGNYSTNLKVGLTLGGASQNWCGIYLAKPAGDKKKAAIHKDKDS